LFLLRLIISLLPAVVAVALSMLVVAVQVVIVAQSQANLQAAVLLPKHP
jgi:hypothetical protein